MRTKAQYQELKAETNFKGWYSGLEGCIFNIGPRYSDKFAKEMKDM